MERAQRAMVSVLLDHIHSLGLISSSTHGRALDLVHSAADFPELFQHPVCLAKEAGGHECAQNTR